MRCIARSTTLFAGIAAGAAALTIGCGSSDATSPQRQFPGIYALRTVNGQPMPYVAQDSAGTSSLTSDVYTFSSDGTFTQRVVGSYAPSGGTVEDRSFDDSGRWTLVGTSVTLTFNSDGGGARGTVSGGNTITFAFGSITAIYRK